MLTQQKLEIYRTFLGDIDGFTRCASPAQKSEMPENDWYLIVNFIQEIALTKRGLADASFVKKLEDALIAHCDSQETVALLQEM